MPTLKQKNLAKITVENIDKLANIEKGELVEMGGYGPAVIKTPSKVLESKGYKEALAEYGLTEELVTCALVDDIKAKPTKRVKELSLAADVLGMKKQDEAHKIQPIINIINFHGNNDPVPVRSETASAPVGNPAEQSPVQVADYSS